MSSTITLNAASLNIARPELLRLIRQAQAEFAHAALPGNESGGFETCAAMLRQVDAVLRVLELHDAAELAREIVAALTRGPGGDATAVEVVTDALEVLVRYPAYLAGCQYAMPELLLDNINALRSLGGMPALPENHFLPECAEAPCRCPEMPRIATAGGEELPRRLRHLYQLGLIGMLRGRDDPVHVRMMQRASERMLGVTGGGASGEFWWLMGGVLEGFASGCLLPGRERLRVLSRADARFRDYLRSAQPSGESLEPAQREELLCLVARSGDGPRAREIRERAGIARPVPGDAQLAQERARLLGAAKEILDALVAETRADFTSAREDLERLALLGEVNAAALEGVRDVLARVRQRLADGGMPGAAAALEQRIAHLDAQRAAGATLGKGELQGIAELIVQTEDGVAAFARARSLPAAAQAAAPAASVDLLDDARRTLLGNARDCLDQVKRDVNAFVDSQFEVQALAGAGGPLAGVRGALLILEHPRAAAIADATVAALRRVRSGSAASVSEAIAEVLADVLICLEYYVAALENAEQPDGAMLALAEDGLRQLRFS